jgi:hypothetical protein
LYFFQDSEGNLEHKAIPVLCHDVIIETGSIFLLPFGNDRACEALVRAYIFFGTLLSQMLL